jgi:hypothetical protein
MLKRLVIENYRSCVQTSLDLDPHLSVLIGPNGSGKTNILQSIMLLNKLAQQRERFGQHMARGGSSRIKASFQAADVSVQLKTSFDTFKSETADEPHLSASQRWLLKARNGGRLSLNIPLSLPSEFGADWTNRYVRHQYLRLARAARERLLLTLEGGSPIPSWVARAMARVAEFCRGIKYYSASQFTNPLSCPSSFEIEEEGTRQRLFRLRGHARLLYDMYSAEQSRKDGRYSRFMDIVGIRGLRLIDGLSFKLN